MMPHLILEHSDNLAAPFDHRALFRELHATLEATGEFRLEQMKSRVVAQARSYVGAGDPANIFAHLRVYLLGGRSLELRRQIAADLLAVLQRGLARSVAGRPSDLTVDVREMTRETYAKAQVASPISSG
jgi:5-carboxymethyl-2-hydroxymuconate isomerase